MLRDGGRASMTELMSGTPFVGRETELRALLEGVDGAVAGAGRLFLIGGEPGIGKSRLADEVATRSQGRGQLVLWGRGWEDAGAPPYWPWVQVLRSYLRRADATEARLQMGAGAGDMAQMLPELCDLFPDVTPPPATNSDSARFQLFDSTTTFLRAAGEARPLVVVLDDLHAADLPSIRYLRFLVRQLAEMRLLVIGTFRDVELTPDHPLTTAMADLSRAPATRRVMLGGLGSRAVGAFLGASVGRQPDERLVAVVERATNGNPLFLAEAVRLLESEGNLEQLGTLPTLHIAVPAGIRDVIARRIGKLSEETGRLLTTAATIGPEFGQDVLRLVADDAPDTIRACLDESVRAGLLAPVSGAPDRYRFSHDLVRETLYDELGPGPRMRLHRRVAEILEQVHAADPEPHLAELAHHFLEAALGGEETGVDDDGHLASRAVDYARRAAERAGRALAYEEAARLYRTALAAYHRGGAPDPRTRLQLLLELGESEARGGLLRASRETYLEAGDIARRLGAAPELARAALGIGGRIPWGRPGRETQLMPLLQDALVHLGGADDRLRVRLLARLAAAWRSSPDRREERAALSQQAVELARRVGDEATLSYALAAGYWATWGPGNVEERARLADEMIAIAESLGDPERLVDAHLMRWLSLTEMGEMFEARDESERIRSLAADLRQPAQQWLGVAPLVLMRLMEGDFARAEELMASEMADAPFTLARDEVSAARMHRFLLLREQGRLTELEEAARASLDDFPWYPVHRAVLVCLLVEIGREDEARAGLVELATDEFRAIYLDNEWLLGTSLAADACALLGDEVLARVLYDQLLPYEGGHAIGHAEGSVGAVDRYLGLLATTLGRLDDAVRHLEQAIAINDRMGARPWSAHSQHDLARALRQRARAGDRARAGELDRAALTTARRVGMTVLESRISEDLGDGAAAVKQGAVTALFRSDGEIWTVRFAEEPFRVRDTKGMGYLARLLGEPGRELHVLDLAGGAPTASSVATTEGLRADAGDGAGPLLDAEAKAAYRERLVDLRAELAQAEEWADSERATRLRGEMEFLVAEVGAAVGLGGRDRMAASATERARVSVTRAIRGAMDRLAAQDAALGRHLEATVRTGTFCSYTPDPRVPMGWEL
jgi:tetratricopeptide (TPR) repeat protein